MRIMFFPMTPPGFEPTKTRLISGQSIYYCEQSHSSDSVVISALLTVSFFDEYTITPYLFLYRLTLLQKTIS